MMNLSKPLQNCEQTTLLELDLSSSDNPYHKWGREEDVLQLYNEWSRKGSSWSTEEQQLLIRLLQDGARLGRICMALGRSPKAIAYRVQLILTRGEELIMVASMYQELATYCPLPHNATLIKQLPPKKKGNKMNHNHVAALLQENFTTVGVVFPNSLKVYIYKVKTPHTLALDDYVVVLASGYFKVASIVEIHDQPQIDTDLDCDYQWIVQKVDRTEWNSLNEKESRFIEALKEVEKQKKRAEVIEDFKKHLAVDSAAAALLDSAVKQLNQVDTEEGETK